MRINKTKLVILGIFILWLVTWPFANVVYSGELPRNINLRIIHTNDLHGHLFPFDYDIFGQTKNGIGGASRMATLIRQLRNSAAGLVLVMDAGDIFSRGPLGDLNGVPDIEIMNAVPYDVMALGNSEFRGTPAEKGLDILRSLINKAKFPVISANIFYKSSGNFFTLPYKIFDFNGVKIGVFGLTATRTAYYPQAACLEFRDPIETARNTVRKLSEKSNFIIALTHQGIISDLELAYRVPGIDAIIGGDSHTYTFAPILVRNFEPGIKQSVLTPGIPVCHAGEWGAFVGKLDLKLNLSFLNKYVITHCAGELVEVKSNIKPAQDIERILKRFAKPYLKKIGKLEKSVSRANAPDWVAKIIRNYAGTQVAIVPRVAIENGLKSGDITILDVRRMFPWVNQVVRLNVKGSQLKDYLLNNDAGIAGAAIKNGSVIVNGSKINDLKFYSVAIEDFYARSSPEFAGINAEKLGITTIDIVIKYFSSNKIYKRIR